MRLQRVRHDLATQQQQQSTWRLSFSYTRGCPELDISGLIWWLMVLLEMVLILSSHSAMLSLCLSPCGCNMSAPDPTLTKHLVCLHSRRRVKSKSKSWSPPLSFHETHIHPIVRAGIMGTAGEEGRQGTCPSCYRPRRARG